MKILVVDIETTGFLRDDGKIVEVGIVELDLVSGERTVVFDAVTHESGISRQEVENAWIIQNSDLTVEAVRLSTNLRILMPEIQSIINGYDLGATAFNKEFDFGFFKSRGISIPTELGCLMKLSTDIVQLPGQFGDYKWPKVEEAYDFFFPESEYVELHRGADDAMHEAEIAHELFKRDVLKIEK